MKAPLHILHIFSTFAVGGPQIRLIQILQGLRGELVTSIMAMDGNLAAAARISGQQVNLLPAPREGNGLSKALAIANLLRRMKPDLVATYNWGAMDAVVGVKLAGVCPFIHGEDGFGPDETLALKRRRILARRLLLRSAYRTVVPSRNLEAIARDQFGLDPKKVTYIPNGVDVARFAPGQNLEYRRARGISDDCVLFGFVGQLRKEKNLTLLLRAFAAVSEPHWRLAIVGDGPCFVELKQLASELAISPRVHFDGGMEDPSACFRAFDVFAMSSMTEQMPISLLEAMASGLPALVTDVGDCRQILSAEFPQVVSSGDLSAYGRAMRQFASSWEARRESGRKNRARCVTEFAEDIMIRRYAGLYEEAVSSRERKLRPIAKATEAGSNLDGQGRRMEDRC